jgi:AmiR/NasT family two-component response regulator
MQEIYDIEELRQRLSAAEERNAQLERALESRVVIEQAKGVLAERLGVSIDKAFEILRYAARSARIGLHELAQQVVEQPRTPSAVVAALARRSRWLARTSEPR